MSEDITNSGEIFELRWVAIFVWHHQRMSGREARLATEQAEAERALRAERFRLELQRIVGERDDISLRINGGCIEAQVDDLRFVAYEIPSHTKPEKLILVSLLGRCSCCGVETMSEPFYNLAGLGKMLERFEPISLHFCHSTHRRK